MVLQTKLQSRSQINNAGIRYSHLDTTPHHSRLRNSLEQTISPLRDHVPHTWIKTTLLKSIRTKYLAILLQTNSTQSSLLPPLTSRDASCPSHASIRFHRTLPMRKDDKDWVHLHAKISPAHNHCHAKSCI